MNKEEIKNKISEHKECCKKLAEEYRQRYNEDKTDKLALNMFYHNVIAYNDFENVLAMIEDRNSMMLCFAEPPILTEKTVEVDINRIAELEKENANLKALRKYELNVSKLEIEKLEKENAELKKQLEMSNKVYNDNLDYSHHIEGQLTYAKTIIQDLLDNTDEYARQRAEDFLKENK